MLVIFEAESYINDRSYKRPLSITKVPLDSEPFSCFHQIDAVVFTNIKIPSTRESHDNPDAVKLQQKLVAGARFNGKTINSNGARKFPENNDAHALIQQLQQLPGK